MPLHGAAPAAGQPPTSPAPIGAPAAPPILLSGLGASQLVRLLGEPAARSPSGQGERWVYRSGACEVEVFVFPDVVHGQPTVLDHRLGAGPGGADAEQACLRKLRDDHAL